MNEPIPTLSQRGEVFRDPNYKQNGDAISISDTNVDNIVFNMKRVMSPKEKIDKIMLELNSQKKDGVVTPPLFDCQNLLSHN